MTIEIGDIVYIGNAEKNEAIGHYGKVRKYVGERQYEVLYRYATANGNINPGVAVVSREDISLTAKGVKK